VLILLSFLQRDVKFIENVKGNEQLITKVDSTLKELSASVFARKKAGLIKFLETTEAGQVDLK